MSLLQSEQEFFKEIGPKIKELVLSYNGNAAVSVQKKYGDYATEVDLAVEDLIVKEINERFPGDAILAEEGHSDTQIPDGRIWIIDPICGTTNIGRAIKDFCSNVALADNRELVASCVVDHSTGDFIWSIGEGVYVNDQTLEYPVRPEGFGEVVDLDFGAIMFRDKEPRGDFADTVRFLLSNTDYTISSINSSLSFAYTATGKLDGFINAHNHPWDISAASFLLQQSGGVITGLDGSPWTVTTIGAIGAHDPKIHQTLLQAYQENHLGVPLS